MLTIGSLFSGIGGIELGFEREGGFEVRWFIENDEYCQQVLRKHWPGVPIYADIRTVDFSRLKRVDVLTGGFPCQDISTANPKGKGIEGERSGLWSYYAEAIRVLRPRYAVIENVPMLANRGLNVVLRDIAEIGYNAEWNIVSARGVGARHLRRRLFIVAYPQLESRYVRADEASGQRRNEQALINAGESDLVADTSSGRAVPVQQSGQLCSSFQKGQMADPESAERERSGSTWRRRTGLTDGGADVADSDQLNSYDGRCAAGAICGNGQEKTQLRGSEDVANAGAARLQGHRRHLNRTGELFAAEARIQLAELRAANMRGIWRFDPADLADTESKYCDECDDNRRSGCGEIPQLRNRFEEETAGIGGRTAQPYVGRVAHGVPKRVDRLRCLGNAVVPQVAQVIARRIREVENDR